MLTREETELLCRVGAGTPMGEMIRRFWVPACLSEELPEADCDPIRVRLLGEDLVAFRDSSGRVGVMEERCPHRQASLFFGRNEEGGLRCVYHGWKIDVAGDILETPCEPAESRMRFHIKHEAYLVVEQGDVVWVYMGPKDEQPPFPNWGWTRLPSENRVIGKIDYDCNYLQATEGAIDHLHSDVLHSGHRLMQWSPEQVKALDMPQYRSGPSAPQWEMQDTSYGFRYAGIKPLPNGEKFVRVSVVALPFHCVLPNVPHMFVPADDEHTWFYDVRCNPTRPVNREASLNERGERVGTDVTPQHFKVRTVANNYGQDRRAMRERKEHWSFSGIAWGKPHQDMAMMETMGAIVDRTKEHLGYSDTVISRLRARMLQAVRHFMETGEVAELDPSIPYDRIAGAEGTIPVDAPWESVGAFAGEPVPELTPAP